jgi:hypothetical protein
MALTPLTEANTNRASAGRREDSKICVRDLFEKNQRLRGTLVFTSHQHIELKAY